jgi:hypothetical protein
LRADFISDQYSVLPALACALALIVTFIAARAPVGLGATLIAAGLILRCALA